MYCRQNHSMYSSLLSTISIGSTPSVPQRVDSAVQPNMGRNRALQILLAISLGALILCWPAIYNRYPLIYPDTMSYLFEGHQVIRALAHSEARPIAWMRSPLFSGLLFTLHWDRTLVLIVPIQALLASYTLWLLIRTLAPRSPVRLFLLLVVGLSLLTGLAWQVSFVMPDLLGPLAYLGLFLLVFRKRDLSRTEMGYLAAISGLGMVAHITHMVMAVAILGVWIALALAKPRWFRLSSADTRPGIVVLLAALALQALLNSYLCRRLTLNVVNGPPFLTARLQDDGPAVRMLQQRCGKDLHLEICQFKSSHPMPADTFLWEEGGIVQNLSSPEQLRMSSEDTALLRDTLRAYPAEQVRISVRNFWQQLLGFGMNNANDSPSQNVYLGRVLRGAGGWYQRGRQAHNAMPVALFSRVQNWTVGLSACLVLGVLVRLKRDLGADLLALTLMIAVVLIGNAFLTGVLAAFDPRYQMRVVWLLPLLAGLYASRWTTLRHRPALGAAEAIAF